MKNYSCIDWNCTFAQKIVSNIISVQNDLEYAHAHAHAQQQLTTKSTRLCYMLVRHGHRRAMSRYHIYVQYMMDIAAVLNANNFIFD